MPAYTFESQNQDAYMMLAARSRAAAIAAISAQGLDPSDGILRDARGVVVVAARATHGGA